MNLSKDILRKTLFLSVDPKFLAAFKRRALRTEKEILAEILGDVYRRNGAMCVKITGLHYPEYAVSTEDEVSRASTHAAAIGTIHSHPNVDYVAQSSHDFNGAIIDGEQIYGIYTFGRIAGYKRKFSSFDWYSPGRVVVVL